MNDEFEKRIRNVCTSTRMTVEDSVKDTLSTVPSSAGRLTDFFTQFYGGADSKDMVLHIPAAVALTVADSLVFVATLPAGTDPDSVIVTLYDEAALPSRYLRVTSDPSDSSAEVFLEQKPRALSLSNSGPCDLTIRVREAQFISNIQIRYKVSYPAY